MAIESPTKLGNNIVVIGIDKDKSSQWAVRWAVEHLLKGKNSNVVLVHVKTHNIPPEVEPAPLSERAPSDSELQQLFLPYRGFCARKGYDAHEVVLQDVDITNALVNYIDKNSIGTVVVGASTRNALTRRFKQTDVPTSLTKAAPEFCTVYVISKGKVQSVRCSSTYNALRTSANSRSSPINNYSRFYFANNSPSNAGSSITDNSSVSSGSSYMNSQVDSPTAEFDPMMTETPDDLSSDSSMVSYYHARLNNMLGQPPTHPLRSNSFDENSRNSYSRESRKSDEMDHLPYYNEGARTPGRFTRSPSPLSPTFKNSPSPPTRFMPSHDTRAGGRGNHLTYMKSMLSDGSSYNSSCSNGSFQLGEYSHDQSSYASTISDNSFTTNFVTEDELDAEIDRLKLAAQKAMDLYQLVTEQAATTKHQADDILNREEEHTIEDIKVARQAAMLVAELERLKAKAAMDAELMSERLTELETEKSKFEQQRDENSENKKTATTSDLSMSMSMTHQVYSFKEIEVATNYFSASQQIGEGGYGPVYRGILNHTPVAIKVLRPDVSQGLEQFEKEIEVLGRIRHPNMVLLLGACPQHGCLIYEYMDNGSLEDRLFRKNNTSPIPWQSRFKIAAEIATALLFLHEAKPKPMVHRDLKPANILLDANYTSKISDVGLARLVPPSIANEMTQYHMTAAAGTFCYIDPEYQQTGLLGTKSDVYSLGVMLLQLITAKPAMALAYNIEEAIETGEFADMLDPVIPNWPVEQALSLAQLALQCCELRKKDRPDLGSVVLPELNRLRDFASCS
ncbi:hypothetical protein RND81_01G064300 [Saponaria officinalis]|uniref:Protein kinase domain-containing protein n=1 Tax=Saponaria officinalis TaxID=3572 RepID=A0AAW1NC11_SAPOF